MQVSSNRSEASRHGSRRISRLQRKGKGKQKLTMTSVLLRVLKEEGISGLYSGFGASMLNTFSMRESPRSNLLDMSNHVHRIRIFLLLLLGSEDHTSRDF